MKLVIQRVSQAAVTVAGHEYSRIGSGLVVLLGVAGIDGETTVPPLARKLAALRIFSGTEGKMNLSVKDTRGEILVVPQFTLLAETADGNRPFFGQAAPFEKAECLYRIFIDELKKLGIANVAEGKFRSHMQLSLVNDGPVTIILESN